MTHEIIQVLEVFKKIYTNRRTIKFSTFPSIVGVHGIIVRLFAVILDSEVTVVRTFAKIKIQQGLLRRFHRFDSSLVWISFDCGKKKKLHTVQRMVLSPMLLFTLQPEPCAIMAMSMRLDGKIKINKQLTHPNYSFFSRFCPTIFFLWTFVRIAKNIMFYCSTKIVCVSVIRLYYHRPQCRDNALAKLSRALPLCRSHSIELVKPREYPLQRRYCMQNSRYL